MEQKVNISVLVTLFISFILLIVSLSTYWWTFKEKSTNVQLYYKYDWIKNITKDETYYQGWDSTNKYTMQLFEASISFAIIAWVFTAFGMVLVLLCIYHEKVQQSKLLTTLTKYTPMVICFFCFLSTFIFVGIPKSLRRDCIDHGYIDPDGHSSSNSGSNDAICDEEHHYHFFGNNKQHIWHPTTGWICICISTGLTFLSTILSMLFSTFSDKIDYPLKESQYLLL
ncbi:hypothetical protein PPL_10446 [Heterostelium album PN500]|uniref:Uncharacterized protein n=1 Tax=Heterostelium pallidum (strain ATCC 26659 / Pp 5 / PN500) TaxID=670386 RepID=D3BR42_HETP5|nr:hypothetical protein PPL_10446 [Heterostelium album PN500]EFA75874.1 hypothetical protein PPL_10446 [Heterostelium album PN500]|eukprot:XP_020428008.1 hypothetical protein PPL_10446 [Heterostelium album PN500]